MAGCTWTLTTVLSLRGGHDGVSGASRFFLRST